MVEVDCSNNDVPEDEGIIDEDYIPEDDIIDESYDPADYEYEPEPQEKETRYHYCGITRFDRLLHGQNNKHRRHTSVTAAYTASHVKTCLTNTQKTAMASTKIQQE